MKNVGVYTFLIIAFLLSCKSETQEEILDSMYNMETIIDEESMLLGAVNRQGLEQEKYKSWFDYNYDQYTPNKEVLSQIGKDIKDIDFKIFMGTWCSDSEREIPAFYKFLDSTEYQPKSFQIISTDRTKKLPEEYLDGFDIVYIPTFILFKKGEELGRIVETPVVSLHDDIYNIINKE